MAFYIRKGIGFGPLRLNLSKSGLGLSAGVTGARVGFGPKGAYVHGGRHGLYYRKYLGKEGARSKSRGNKKREVNYFIDTGLTYNKGVKLNRTDAPDFPEAGKNSALSTISGIAGFGTLFAGWIFSSTTAALIGLALISVFIFTAVRYGLQKKKANRVIRELSRLLEDREPFERVLRYTENLKFHPSISKQVNFALFTALNEVFYEDPDYIKPRELIELESKLGLDRTRIERIKADAFRDFLDEVLEDHVVSEEEQEKLRQVQKELRIPDEYIEGGKVIIKRMIEMRDSIAEEMNPIDVDFSLKRGETMYYRTEGRMLKSKIMNRFQENRVVYKETGYEIDLEGTIYLSDNRILIVGEGSREYLIKHVLDVTMSVEDNTVQVVTGGRKTPVILTMPDIAVFTGKLKNLCSDEETTQ